MNFLSEWVLQDGWRQHWLSGTSCSVRVHAVSWKLLCSEVTPPDNALNMLHACRPAVPVERDAWQKPVQSAAISERGRAQAADEMVKQV